MINDLADIPHGTALKKLCQSIATLDMILMPEWMWRYYSFKVEWDTGVDLFSMRDGSGDEMFVLFTSEGILIKGFAHESPISPYQADPPRFPSHIFDKLPPVFRQFMDEPALSFISTTFCLWQTINTRGWSYGLRPTLSGDDVDGSQALLSILDGKPKTYQVWANEYYERPIPLDAVAAVYTHQPLNVDLVQSINAERDWKSVLEELRETGYPIK